MPSLSCRSVLESRRAVSEEILRRSYSLLMSYPRALRRQLLPDRAPALGLRRYLMNSDSLAMVLALARPGLVLDVFITLILL